MRYIGGVKLSVCALVRAYGKSVHLRLEKDFSEEIVGTQIKHVKKQYLIDIKSLYNFEHNLKSFENIILQKNSIN